MGAKPPLGSTPPIHRVLLIAGIIAGLIVAGLAGYLIASPSTTPLATLVFAADVRNVSGEWSSPLVISPSLEHHLLAITTWVNLSNQGGPGCFGGIDFSAPCSFWLNYTPATESSNPINSTDSFPLQLLIQIPPGSFAFTVLVLECTSLGGNVSCSKASYDLVVKVLDLGVASDPV